KAWDIRNSNSGTAKRRDRKTDSGTTGRRPWRMRARRGSRAAPRAACHVMSVERNLQVGDQPGPACRFRAQQFAELRRRIANRFHAEVDQLLVDGRIL